MLSIYDESIFSDQILFKKYKIVGVSNRADAFLLSKLNDQLQIVKPCHEKAQITVNPTKSCRGQNVYSMKLDTSRKNKFLKFNKISVEKIPNAKVLEIADDVPDASYTDNSKLTNLEQAIMIKKYAIDRKLRITYELYTKIYKEFDNRPWFTLQTTPVIQNINHEVSYDSMPLNLPNLDFYEYELQM